MIVAAGILFVTGENRALFLKRGPGGDCPGEWCFPGGKQEPEDDNLEATARRESKEELGEHPQGTLRHLSRRIANREIAGGTGPVQGKLPVPALVQAAAQNTPAGDAVVVPEEQVDFTTFVQKVSGEFAPKLDGEHVGWCWAPIDQPPEPLHPGCRTALACLTADETQIARLIQQGELTSPQKFENVWLFDIRVTGTGMAFRREKRDADNKIVQDAEFVWRDPALYLNDHFLARCNGLPVVVDHPEGMMLDPKEYADRVVGSLIMPYVKGEDVWSIARIYDDVVATAMRTQQLSTSPGVVFRDMDKDNTKVTTEDGDLLLIEGKPSLLDHLAICKRGVWDKGGEPTGVRTEGVSSMTEEEKNALREQIRAEERAAARKDADEAMMDKARKDADEERERKIDKLCDSVEGTMSKLCDSVEDLKKRMDAFDGKRAGDSEEEKTEEKKDKKDSEESEEKKDKKDSEKEEEMEKKDSKKDAEISELRAEIAAMKAKIPVAITDDDYDALAGVQARADSVFSFFGKRASRPLDGETVLGYRKRLAKELQVHSPTVKDLDLSAINDSAVFDPIERMIYADAEKAGVSPATVPAGTLRERRSRSDSGHNVTTFIGEPKAWLSDFTHGRRRVRMFNHKAA